MNREKLLKFVSALAVGMVAVVAHAQQLLPVTITPATGQYIASQRFDIAVNVPPSIALPEALTAPYYDPYGVGGATVKINAFVNGRDVTPWFSECMQEHRTVGSQIRILLCKVLDTSPFTVGLNTLRVDIVTGGQTYSASADYNFIASERKPRLLPYHFQIQGVSVNTKSGIKVSQNERVYITATGNVNVWPANVSYPISTPRGVQTCVASSTCLLPGAPVGGLLVKIGAYGRWTFVGSSYSLVADRPGELIFAVNDKSEQVDTSDNTGSYDVYVSK